MQSMLKVSPGNFNPRSLAGATYRKIIDLGSDEDFNPRSLAGATFANLSFLFKTIISIHAPLRERPFGIVYSSKIRPFQSTLPCGSDIC